uniref:BPM/SPOP BACK domain-containing protein n=1 Tax=Oryza punctata TaxID=4537 RepID=A0A0E0M7V7_ORYPU
MKKPYEVAMPQQLLVAADRYDLKRLRLLCEHKLCKHVNKSTVASMLGLVDQRPSCQGLKKACFEYLHKSPKVLREIMATEAFDHLVNELLLSKLAVRVWVLVAGCCGWSFTVAVWQWNDNEAWWQFPAPLAYLGSGLGCDVNTN